MPTGKLSAADGGVRAAAGAAKAMAMVASKAIVLRTIMLLPRLACESPARVTMPEAGCMGKVLGTVRLAPTAGRRGMPLSGKSACCISLRVSEADLSPPRTTRAGVAALVAVLHVAAIVGLVRAFAPDFSAEVVQQVADVLTVTITAPPPPVPESQADLPFGAAGAAGKRVTPREVVAPRPEIVMADKPAPLVAGKGADNASGARDAGSGSGAGGAGSGTGSGAGGDGQGGGGAAGPVKIAGDINSARDYPKSGRAMRRDDHVVIVLTVGTDGQVKGCRIHRASRDEQADRITCELASQRFRFRPATDRNGNAIESVYGWQQRWFDPREKN